MIKRLRFVEQDDGLLLQQLVPVHERWFDWVVPTYRWKDVPVVKFAEPKNGQAI